MNINVCHEDQINASVVSLNNLHIEWRYIRYLCTCKNYSVLKQLKVMLSSEEEVH